VPSSQVEQALAVPREQLVKRAGLLALALAEAWPQRAEYATE
jgi:hypothetical protein